MSAGSGFGGDGRASGCGITAIGLIYSVGLVGLFGTAYFFVTAQLLHYYGNVDRTASWVTAAALLLVWGGVLAFAGWRGAGPAGQGDWLDRMMGFAMGFAPLPLMPVIFAGAAVALFCGAALVLMQLGHPPDPPMFVLAGILAVSVAVFLWLAMRNEVLDKATDYDPKAGIGLAVLGAVLGFGFDFKMYYGLIVASVALWAVIVLLVRSFPTKDPAHPARYRVARLMASVFVAAASAVLVAGLLGHLGFEVYESWAGAK